MEVARPPVPRLAMLTAETATVAAIKMNLGKLGGGVEMGGEDPCPLCSQRPQQEADQPHLALNEQSGELHVYLHNVCAQFASYLHKSSGPSS